MISTAHGLKFVEIKVKYHQKELDFPAATRTSPSNCPRARCRQGRPPSGPEDRLKRRTPRMSDRNELRAERLAAPPRWPSTASRPRAKAHHAVSTPIVQTSNFYFESTAEVFEFMKAKGQGQIIREHGIRPLRQPHAAGGRTQARRHRRRRARHPLLHRHERGHPDAHGLHEEGRPHPLHQRLLPADARFRDQLPRPSSAFRRHPGRPDRRGHREGDPAQHQHHLHRVADQSVPARARPAGHRQGGQDAQAC